jgi:uncharacterized protein (TIGR00725 family)
VTGVAGHPDSGPRVAVFFGGVVPGDVAEEQMAYEIGYSLGAAGFTLRHGGYNGLMEQAARGAMESGQDVIAVSHQGMNWGPHNPYVTESIDLPDLGSRLMYFLQDADVVVGMAGGVGTLHELTAAFWYAGNVRPVPVIIVGAGAMRLVSFLLEHHWLFETPTRPLGFLTTAETAHEFTTRLDVVRRALDVRVPS